MMENASIHMSDEVDAVIENASAVVICRDPFSPHLNPIENYFSVYKKYIKRNGEIMKDDWRVVHLEALDEVGEDMGLNYSRSCNISCA